MDIAFEQPFALPSRNADAAPRLLRSAVVAIVFGALAVWGAAGALATGSEPGFEREPVGVTTERVAMFSVRALEPGQTVTRYASVTPAGSPASVRLFGTVRGGLDRFLTLTVTRGTGGADGFVPAAGAAATVFSGPMSEFPSGWAGGLDVGDARTPDGTETFRFDVRLADEAAAQGLTASADFRWEARAA